MSKINEKYSYKDFLNVDLSELPAEEFNNTTIIGSCFYQPGKKKAKIFPGKMDGVTFINCNLDNVKLPNGNTVGKGCSNRNIECLDGEDWVVDDDVKIKKVKEVIYGSS